MRAEIKHKQYKIDIYKVMRDSVERGNTLSDALREGDEYLNKQIRINPQEKQLILQAAYEVKADLEKFLEENR